MAKNISPLIKLIILSEGFFWSAWSATLPLLSVFALTQLNNIDVQTIAFGYSLHLVFRIIGSTLSGFRQITKATLKRKLIIIIVGIFGTSLAYLLFALASDVTLFYLAYLLAGLVTGMISPIRTTLFCLHLDPNIEETEWAIHDDVILIGMAVMTFLGGLISNHLSFATFFAFAALINWLSSIPFCWLYLTQPSDLLEACRK